MGNNGCKCLQENQSNEIVTKKDDMYSTRAAGTTNEINKSKNDMYYEETVARAKAQNHITPDYIQQSLNSEAMETPPGLNENYMEYAMDFFDEVNKYRCNSDLFVDLKKKNPSNLIKI